jgi:Asp/Glu/hydantoin racemase
MAQTLAIIHTSPTLTPLFTTLCTQQMPETTIFHMVDESLIKDTVRAGALQKITMRRLISMVESAGMSGADAVLVTCSSIGPAVSIAQGLFDFPVIRIDEAMAEAAVRAGKSIGVMATLKTTLEPTIALLRDKAAEAALDVEIVSSLCAGAFEAVLAGDTTTHDRILSEALINDMRNVDVIVLAQASMARVVKEMPSGSLAAPVLSSPELAVSRVHQILSGMESSSSSDTREMVGTV